MQRFWTVAAVVWARLAVIADDLRLCGIALARTVTDSGERHTLEDVAAELGIDLNDDPDDQLRVHGGSEVR